LQKTQTAHLIKKSRGRLIPGAENRLPGTPQEHDILQQRLASILDRISSLVCVIFRIAKKSPSSQYE